MVDERRSVPAGVAIAAVILGIMAFLGLLMASSSAFVLFTMHNPLVPRIPFVRITFAGLEVLVIALVILSACTIVGLFRLRLWARYAIALLGLLDFVTFGLLAIAILIVRVRSGMAAMPMPNNPNLTLGDILLMLAVFNAALAMIGIWWLIYFNVKSVRQVFAESEEV